MFVLILLIFGFIILVICRKTWQRDLSSLKEQVIVKEEELAMLSREKESAEAQVAVLNKKLETLIAVYDISRELSKVLDARKAAEVFLERLQKALVLRDCFLTYSDIYKGQRKSCRYLTVCVENENPQYLVVDSDSKIEANLLALAVHQLALGFRRAKLYLEVQKSAITDGLTGVYTRRYFSEKINQELQRAKSKNLCISFLMLDIDYFKSYNDAFGHLTGDALLKEMAMVITSKLRSADVCCRWGGEEFCISLPETDKEGAYLVAERLRATIEDTQINIYGEHLKLTASIGVAVSPGDGQRLDLLVGKADQALYKAKKSGRNRVCVYGMKI